MLRDILVKLSKLSMCAVMVACSTTGDPAFADDASPLTIKLTPASPSRISLGEPFVIHYRINNEDPTEQVTFHAGSDNDQWYTVTLRGQKGLSTQASKPPQKSLRGFSLSPERSVPPGDYFTDDIVATRGLAVPAPGRYTLTIHVDTPYYLEPRGVGARYSDVGVPDPPTGRMTQDFSFPLVVTPADPAKLRAMAEKLEESILNPLEAGSSRSRVEQLFSLPEAQALPAWKALITDPKGYSSALDETVKQLGGLKTDTAADLLVLMQHRPDTRQGTTPRVDGVLAEMYNTGTPALRQHIKMLATSQGAELVD